MWIAGRFDDLFGHLEGILVEEIFDSSSRENNLRTDAQDRAVRWEGCKPVLRQPAYGRFSGESLESLLVVLTVLVTMH
jgi:hypothetical protein